MSDDLNKVIEVGRLTRDAELQYTNSGFALCKFQIAVNRRRKQGEQWVEDVYYFEVNVWGRRGESLHQYLTKGTQVGIEGGLRQDRWEQDGVKRSKIYIEAVNVQLLGGNRDGSGNSGAQGGRSQGQSSQRPNPSGQQGKGRGQPGGQQQGKPPQRPAQSGGRDSFNDYTPPSGPIDDYEDDIPF